MHNPPEIGQKDLKYKSKTSPCEFFNLDNSGHIHSIGKLPIFSEAAKNNLRPIIQIVTFQNLGSDRVHICRINTVICITPTLDTGGLY